MAPFKKTLNSILIALLVIAASGCANQMSPPGGDVDTTPPQIIELIPADRTVNYTGKSLELTFSEYVERRSVQDNIFISPKPSGELEFSWSGRSVEVIFSDSLKKNTTYSVTVGANVIDINNNNKMAEPFSFSFSTGPVIDTCTISGKVYEPDPSGVLIFAYKDKGDTLNIAKTQPDYISQVGKNGNYLLAGLGKGEYKVFAVKDKLGDYTYGASEDHLGIPKETIMLTDSMQSYAGMDFFLFLEDTVKPHISKIAMTDKYHLAVEFTKSIDSIKVKPDNFSITDSLSGKTVKVKYFYKGQGKPLQYFAAFNDSVPNSTQLYLNVKNIPDKLGNVLVSESASFVYNAKPDTSAAKMIKINGQYPEDLLDYEQPEIYVQFDDAFSDSALANGISVFDAKEKRVPHTVKSLDNSSFIIAVSGKQKPKSELNLKIDLKLFRDFSGKSIDSVYQKKFTIINDIDFSGALGSVVPEKEGDNLVVVLEKAEREKTKYSRKADKKGNFEFKKVIPGKYLLWSYIDSDGNSGYSKGKINPLNYSEKFKFYPDTLNLRARWPVGELQIDFDKKKK